MTLSDDEVRHKVIDLLTLETARDKQRRVGASNISNPCDYCLACAFAGVDNRSGVTDRDWMGRVTGTAYQLLLEHRTKEKYPNHLVEYNLPIGVIPGYGEVRSTLDWAILEEEHLIDNKNITIEKTVYLRDYLGQTNYGRDNRFEPIFSETSPGTFRKAKSIVSESIYAEKLREAEYKVTGYCGQLSLYARGLIAQGKSIKRMTNAFIVRDSSGHFDNPALDGYSDNTKMHGVWVLSWDYDADYAEAVWDRGVFIYKALEEGATVEDFAHHELCFPCKMNAQQAERATEKPTHQPTTPVAEVSFLGEAA